MSGRLESPFDEPLLAVDEIQGNVLPGFMKPHMALIAIRFDDAAAARRLLRALPITSLAQVMQSRREVRAARTLQPHGTQVGALPYGLNDQWLNIAFTFPGLQVIAKAQSEREKPDDAEWDSALARQVREFQDRAFRLGLPMRSAALGDPTDPEADGHPDNWLVGGTDNEVHALIVLAADRPTTLSSAVRRYERSVREHGCTVVHRDDGAKFDLIGSEHFGFQDGISQPGVRGRVSEHEFLHRRVVDTDPDRLLYGLPGQFLVWPGEFVFGYPCAGADPLVPGAVHREGPAWSHNGSYLVFRRLRQDVKGFWDWVAESASDLRARPGFEDWSDDRLAAALVGRWKSGAPVSRTPTVENKAMGLNRLVNNLFGFAKTSQPVSLLAAMTTANPGWPEAEADPIGLVCPQAAHIRKVNTRETPNDLGAGRSNLDRRILRHGIPYGRSYADTQDADEDRGLLFVSYQASVERQFEFLSTRWMNSSANPRSPGGHDLLVGQNGQPGENRKRSAVIFGMPKAPGEPPPVAPINASTDFITPTGGGYFFSPSISAVHEILGTPS